MQKGTNYCHSVAIQVCTQHSQAKVDLDFPLDTQPVLLLSGTNKVKVGSVMQPRCGHNDIGQRP